MTSKEFREKIEEVSTDELFLEIENLLSSYGLVDVKVNGFSVESNYSLTDKQECENDGGKYVCRMEDGVKKCKCQGRKQNN